MGEVTTMSDQACAGCTALAQIIARSEREADTARSKLALKVADAERAAAHEERLVETLDAEWHKIADVLEPLGLYSDDRAGFNYDAAVAGVQELADMVGKLQHEAQRRSHD